MTQDQTAAWTAIEDEPIPDTVFDVVAKYYDPILDRFLSARFANCIQVDDVVMWSSPFDKLYQQEKLGLVRLTDHGFRPTHWMQTPGGPKE